jgi:polyphosphate kinase 2 (PPK2 family)
VAHSVFEVVELGSSVSKQELEEQLSDLRVALVNAQTDLREADFSVIVIVMGTDRPGCDAVVHRLHEWMDARFLPAFSFDDPSDEEIERPIFWRYTRTFPARGQAHLLIDGWYGEILRRRIQDEEPDVSWRTRLDRVEHYERALADNGTLLIKLWLHLPEKALKKRVKKNGKNGGNSAAFDRLDELVIDRYDEVLTEAAELVRKTSTAHAPWQIIESSDARHRDLTSARAIRVALEARLAAKTLPPPAPATSSSGVTPDLLGSVDLDADLDSDEYDERRREAQARLGELSAKARRKKRSSVLVFEGWDAAGKGGVIRRLTTPMDVRDYKLVPIGAPTDEELAHHYLWRFWRHVPRAGRMLIFDRSWYGRVLVERVEGLARENEWQRAYGEWLHIDPDEQLRRFQAREETVYKKHKITAEDYRNREKWDDYLVAVSEMVARTSTDFAPWHLVAANSKRNARVEVLETVCKALEDAL